MKLTILESYSQLPTWQKALIVGLGVPVGLAGGIVAAPAVGAIVSTAGFGVLGGALSGAAASSAGLAALGGGAVVTGGLGMAGGTAVVATGVAAATTSTLAVASKFASNSGRKSKTNAEKAWSRVVDDNDILFDE